MDLIVCFDSSASPTRNIQRMGRTGCHRAGRVVYVLAAGKEAEAYYRGQDEMSKIHVGHPNWPTALCKSRTQQHGP